LRSREGRSPLALFDVIIAGGIVVSQLLFLFVWSATQDAESKCMPPTPPNFMCEMPVTVTGDAGWSLGKGGVPKNLPAGWIAFPVICDFRGMLD